MALGDGLDCTHVRRAAVKMHRNDRAGARSDGAFDLRGIEVRGCGIDVHKHRPRSAVGDGFRGGQKRVRAGDHFIARLHSESQQTEMERGGAGAERDAVLRAAIVCELALEELNFLPQNERGFFTHAIESRKNLLAQSEVFAFQIEQWNFHRAAASSLIKTVLYAGAIHKDGSPSDGPAKCE